MHGSEADEFTAFVAKRAHELLKAAHALTGDQYAAEDLVQNALAKAFLRWRQINDEPEPYVRRIIYHDFVSSWRRRRRRKEVFVATPPESAVSRALDDEVAVRLALRQALLALPPKQRAVIVLRFLEDLSLEETAAILSLRQGTVASQTSRALAQLRRVVPDIDIHRDLAGAPK